VSNKSSQKQRATELHTTPAHAHLVAEHHGKQDCLSGAEQSRNAQEHDRKAHDQTVMAGNGSFALSHEEISALAHELWRARGCPEGSSDEDWFRATQELQARNARR
jgi:hypothetical protein